MQTQYRPRLNEWELGVLISLLSEKVREDKKILDTDKKFAEQGYNPRVLPLDEQESLLKQHRKLLRRLNKLKKQKG